MYCDTSQCYYVLGHTNVQPSIHYTTCRVLGHSAVISFYTLILALICILSHASYISDLLDISIFTLVEHQNIRLDALCQHNK